MRTFRVLVFGMLLVSGLVALAPGASASAPAVSKTCQSLNTLNQNLEQAIARGNLGKYDSGAIDNLSKSFRKAAKTAPKTLKSAMNTIADVAANVARAGNTTAAAAALAKGGQKFSLALATWSTYLAKNCSVSPSTT